MRLQKNTLLALSSVLEFAARPGETISATEIAGKYGMSSHHLAKVLRTLGRAGLVRAARGVGGGYRFAANVKRVTLLDVIDLFEDIRASASEPVRPRVRRTRGRTGGPIAEGAAAYEVDDAIGTVLAEIDEIARATFRSITLATMLKLLERRRRA